MIEVTIDVIFYMTVGLGSLLLTAGLVSLLKILVGLPND